MTQRIDLMPESCRRKLGRHRQIQAWLTCYAATAALIVSASVILGFAEKQSQERVDYLLEQVQLDADQQRQAQELNETITRHEAKVRRYERLSWPFEVGDVFASLGVVAPPSVTLSSVALTPRTEAGRRSGGAGSRFRTMYVELSGIAPDDLDVATFVAGLQEHPLFSHITVDYARKATIGDAAIREFGITCEIDLATRYVSDASVEGES